MLSSPGPVAIKEILRGERKRRSAHTAREHRGARECEDALTLILSCGGVFGDYREDGQVQSLDSCRSAQLLPSVSSRRLSIKNLIGL